jgi:CheY-like chemotaxis protein
MMRFTQEGNHLTKLKPAILLLENSDDDILLFRRALSNLGIDVSLSVVNTVQQARSYMAQFATAEESARDEWPRLIVCDYGLDGETSSEFVHWVRNHSDFRAIPMVFFSGTLPPSQAPYLMRRFGIPFFQKSLQIEDTVESVKEILSSAGFDLPGAGSPLAA